MPPKQKNLYCVCEKPATWVRRTQFVGDHSFCAKCAKQENDFGKSDPSYFFWEKVSAANANKHTVQVAGYDGSLRELAEAVLRLRYDKVEEFFQHCVTELRRQADGDRKRGRRQLAKMLDAAAKIAKQQRVQFSRIFALCKPYMTSELNGSVTPKLQRKKENA